jgi:hypothetical protein
MRRKSLTYCPQNPDNTPQIEGFLPDFPPVVS